MKIKTRFLIAFFTIIIVPLLLMFVALMGFSRYQLQSIEADYGIKDTTYENLSNSIQVLSQFTKSICSDLHETAVSNPEDFENTRFLDEINEALFEKSSYLIVRKEETLVYQGIQGNIQSLVNKLPEYGDYKSNLDGGVYIGEDVQALVKQVDFRFSDGSEGSAFVVTSVRNAIPQVKALITEMFIAIVFILIFTSAILTAWIYRGINTPLSKLKLATQNIKEGNLDFTLEVKNDDEVGELCQDFEEMRKRLKESAEAKLQYDKENKELLSNISHDLKTPITAIKGYVEGIMDGVADTPEKMDKYIRTIYNKANDMDRLINELTFYTKIDTNRIPYTFDKINVAGYFNDCVEEVSLELVSKNIKLTYVNYVDDDVYVIADAEQMKRVINNIVSNSIKYMNKKDGFISIRVRDVGDFIQVEIEDNGKGIAAKDLPFIFDRFYRTDASRNSSQGGSGIGLSIVKKIIEDHGGKIWAASKESTGTVMNFVLRKYQEVPINE